jgi:gas vesicle protein
MASTKSFLSILAGLAAGAAIGILYAPDKGWKTRARVKKAAANGYEDMKENLGDLGAKVDEKTAEAKETINNLRDTLREKGSEIKEGTRKLLVEQLERLEKALKQAEEAAEEAAGEAADAVPDDQNPQA